MGAAFDDAALVEHNDLVGSDDGGQAVGDHERSSVVGDAVERTLYLMLGVAVERARRLVQHQDRRRL
jgi:hypothetical protein